MYINLIRTILLAFMLCCSVGFSQKATSRGELRSTNPLSTLDGTYEFISQETWVTKPVKEHFRKSTPDWSGQWQIQDGYFTSTLMQRRREKFLDCENQELGFESYAGTYELEAGKITLNQAISFHPYYEGRSVLMSYVKRGDMLELTKVLTPHVEDEREGKIVITLKKLR